MPDEKPVGRAPVRKPSKGRASVGRAVGKAPTPERALTDVIRDDTPPSPIFVDPSGSRRRRVRWIAYVIGLLLIVVVVAVWVTQLTGPATPPPVPAPCPSACAR